MVEAYWKVTASVFFSDEQKQMILEKLKNRISGDGYLMVKASEARTQLSNKKKALEIAIGEARGELIITTDADCIVPPGWLRHITGLYEEEQAVFIAAPVSFTPGDSQGTKNTLYYFQSLDFMTMQGITAASVRMNLGSMCNGANLAFSKAAFDTVGGYKGIDHIASGDDMLLMHKMQQHYPGRTRYLKSEAAIVATAAQPGWRDFLNQRIRWSSKAASVSRFR